MTTAFAGQDRRDGGSDWQIMKFTPGLFGFDAKDDRAGIPIDLWPSQPDHVAKPRAGYQREAHHRMMVRAQRREEPFFFLLTEDVFALAGLLKPHPRPVDFWCRDFP